MATTYADGTLLRSGESLFVVIDGQRRLVNDDKLLAEVYKGAYDEATDPTNGEVTGVLGGLVSEVPESLLESIPEGLPMESVLEFRRDKDGIARTGYMTTWGTYVPSDGHVEAHTEIWSVQALKGFTGGVELVFEGPAGEYLHRTGLRQYGVDGKRIPFKRSYRLEHWVDFVPAEVAGRVAGIHVLHSHAPRDRFNAIVDEVLSKGLKMGEAVAQIYAKFQGVQ